MPPLRSEDFRIGDTVLWDGKPWKVVSVYQGRPTLSSIYPARSRTIEPYQGPYEVLSRSKDPSTLEIGDLARFIEPGFPRTGTKGRVIHETPFALTIAWEDDLIPPVSTWRRDYFERVVHASDAARELSNGRWIERD